MPLSIPQVCNMALSAIGNSQFIDNIEERSEPARVCKVFYEPARQQMLRVAMPQFARQTIKLALIEKNPTPEWSYMYRYPTDVLKIVYIPSPSTQIRTRIPWEWGNNGEHKVLFTNEPEAHAVVIKDASEQFFDPEFADLLSLYLATKIAMPLAVDPGIQQSVDQRFLFAQSQAMASIANEQQRAPDPDSEITRQYSGYGHEDKSRG